MKAVKMTAQVKEIIAALDRNFPDPQPFLHFQTPYELLIATILSAQCTDERVNKVTPALFAAANTPEKMITLSQSTISRLIHSCGFFNAKSKSILATSHTLIEKFNGVVPADLEKLQTLPGVGRKTASVVLTQAFNIPAFPVDTHVLRVANRLSFAKSKDPTKVDLQARKKIASSLWRIVHLQIILLGRSWCRPKPKCPTCPLREVCPYPHKTKT
ncbi:endonuclease III [Candidatus Gracilibacteria bacterium]|nr:endonuclease III [Candidatus Gracilibacteria bacterium]